MSIVYIRVLFYFLAPLMGMLPGVVYDAAAAQIIIDIETAAYGLAGSGALTAAVFAVWGKK